MEPTITFWDFLHIFGAAQGVFFGVLFLFHKKGKPLANRFLGILLLLFSIRLLEIVAFWTKYILTIPYFIGTAFPVAYLFGVLFYFYIKYLVSDSQKFDRNFWWHLIPFVLVLLMMSPLYLMSMEAKREMIVTLLTAESFESQGINWVVLIQFPHILTYTWLSVRILNTRIGSNQRALPESTYRWLKILIIGFATGYCFWVFNGAGIIVDRTYFRMIDYISTSMMAVFVYAIGYLAFKIPELHSARAPVPKYSNSSLTSSTAVKLKEQLQHIMNTEKLYLNSGLSLALLSEKLGVSSNHLSQLLNEQLNQNFFEFVNSYRIEEAKRILTSPESKQYTLSSIAFEVGFNNKTSFNTYFKKLTGMTPSEFSARAHS